MINNYTNTPEEENELQHFFTGKSEITLTLFDHFINEFKRVGPVTVHPAKTMIGIANSHKRVAWITAFGKNFIHVVFPFKQPYPDNLCFQKIAQVPGDAHQFNHHFRMLQKEDVNEEIIGFMQLAFKDESE